MRLVRVVGLSVLAVLVLGALASAAQAGEVGECVKAVKEGKRWTGRYLDKNCTVEASAEQVAEAKKNKYEFLPGHFKEAKDATFTAKGGTAVFEGPAGAIACRESRIVGEWTGATTDTEQTTFTGCEFKGADSYECHSAGQVKGTIVTERLDSRLIDAGETGSGGGPGPVAGEVWDEEVSPSGPVGVQKEYLCAEIVVNRETGNVAGVLTAASLNVMTKKGEISFSKTIGEQDLVNEASIAGGPFEPAGPGFDNYQAEIKFGGKVEIES